MSDKIMDAIARELDKAMQNMAYSRYDDAEDQLRTVRRLMTLVNEDEAKYEGGTRVGRDVVGGVTVSTVLLPQPLWDGLNPLWETCLFDLDGGSQVVGQYESEFDAYKGHVVTMAALNFVIDREG